MKSARQCCSCNAPQKNPCQGKQSPCSVLACDEIISKLTKPIIICANKGIFWIFYSRIHWPSPATHSWPYSIVYTNPFVRPSRVKISACSTHKHMRLYRFMWYGHLIVIYCSTYPETVYMCWCMIFQLFPCPHCKQWRGQLACTECRCLCISDSYIRTSSVQRWLIASTPSHIPCICRISASIHTQWHRL